MQKRIFIASVLSAGAIAHSTIAQDFSRVPGVVIDYKEAPPRNIVGLISNSDRKYIGSPSITILDDGTYIASRDEFGPGSDENTTWVYRSNDRGQTWINVSTVNHFWSTVFSHSGELYIMGPREVGDNGDLIIRKSTDKGSTWTDTTVIREGVFGGTPNTPVIYNGRLWITSGGTNAMSAPVNSDLMNASSWSRTNGISQSAGQARFGDDWQGWSEGQIAASPQTGVIIMNKIRALPYAGLIDVISPTATRLSDEQFVSFPGGEKKFGVQYDAVSGKFYALSNPVLPAEATGVLDDEPELIRTTGAVMSSTDAVNWDVEKIFLYTRNKDNNESSLNGVGEAFQYFNYAVDGDDMAVVSRTAIDVGDGENDPPRGHDSNLLTFHRIEDFRSLTPQHVLVADTAADRVMRYEYANTNHLAPLGEFNLGATYAGRAMNNPMGGVQNTDGDVFITEASTSGRILRFDAAGNFKQVVATAGVDFTGTPDQITLGADGNLYMSVAFGTNSDKVYKVNPDTGHTSVFVDTNFAPGQSLNNPRGLAFASNGNLYVTDRENDRIRVFNGETGAHLGDIAVGQSGPQALAWDSDNNRLLFSRKTSDGDWDIARSTLSGSILTLYTDTDIGNALGVVSIEGQVFWTDFSNGEIYASTSETDKAKTVSATKNLSGTAGIVEVTAPGRDNRSWINDANGDWADPLNWIYWGRPDTDTEIATFGTATSTTRSLNINAGERFVMKGLRFVSDNTYRIQGDGVIVLGADSGPALVDVQKGNHEVNVNIEVRDDVHVHVEDSAQVIFGDSVDLNKETLIKTGGGRMIVNNAFMLDGGGLVLDGVSPLIFGSGSRGKVELDGFLRFSPSASMELEEGSLFTLLEATTYLQGETFDQLILPILNHSLAWDLSALYSDGTLSVVAVPEPIVGSVLLIPAFLSCRRNR